MLDVCIREPFISQQICTKGTLATPVVNVDELDIDSGVLLEKIL